VIRAGRDTILLLIDHQVGPLWEFDCAPTRRRVVELARGAQCAGLPTIVTTIAPEAHGPLIPELATTCLAEPFVLRSRSNAWDDREVRHTVAALGRPRLVVAGGDVERSVIPCALAARRDGFQVDVVLDACGPSTSRAVARVLDGGAAVTTTRRVIAELSIAERLVAV